MVRALLHCAPVRVLPFVANAWGLVSTLNNKNLAGKKSKEKALKPFVEPAVEQQLKLYEEALQHFQHSRFLFAPRRSRTTRTPR